ncbi:MAG: class I SAM-dependent methyltransferase [Gammaproteobacteria bacterium]
MTKPKSDSSFTTDVARFYESSLVPLIFQPYAADLAARAQAHEPNALLEIACGTGVVTRVLADVLSPACTIEATDLNEAMVSHAESLGTSRPVNWRQADVMSLPFEDDSFDVVVCQFAVMFFPDRVAAYREVRRVLRPGGKFLFNVWRDIETNEFANVVTRAVGGLYPDNPPLFLARTPYGHGSRMEIQADVAAAGYEMCEIAQRDDISAADNPANPAIAFCQGTPLRNEIEERDAGGLELATATAAAALESRFGSGSIEGRISAFVVETS